MAEATSNERVLWRLPNGADVWRKDSFFSEALFLLEPK